jgi:hypothetical protein
MTAIPMEMSIPPIILPSAVTGYTSPYPVVVIVVNANQNASPKFLIVDPSLPLSTVYIPKAPKIIATVENTRK